MARTDLNSLSLYTHARSALVSSLFFLFVLKSAVRKKIEVAIVRSILSHMPQNLSQLDEVRYLVLRTFKRRNEYRFPVSNATGTKYYVDSFSYESTR